MENDEFNVKELLDSAPDAMVIVDPSGVIQFVNVQTEALFGYRREALVGQSVEVLLPDRYRATHPTHRANYFASPKVRPMGAKLELFGRRSDGTEFPVEISLSPVETAGGMLVSSAIRDVTDRKEIQRELIEARDEARRANRAKSAFLAAASHDLRQPLQTLGLLNTVLKKTVTDERAVSAVEHQAQALGGMTDLLNSLLDISKLESGAVKPDIADCEIRAIFSRLRSEFQLQAEAKGLQLLVDDCIDVVRTDPGLLEQIIQNLVSNAIRYTRQGLVQLRCLHLDGTVRIEVLDTGVGIPVDELDRIFEEYYQLEGGSGQSREGLGLGLSIVRRLARLLEHPLQVESTPGKGTCFSVTVPRGTFPLGRDDEAVPAAVAPARAARVLIVDDDPAVADATAMLLEVEGNEVMSASDYAETAAVVSARGVPDVIVSDFHLSGEQTGVDVIRALRSDAGWPVPAILVTGDTSSAIPDLVAAVAPCRVLSKPVDSDELLRLVQALTADSPD